jgi:hypothetical protein
MQEDRGALFLSVLADVGTVPIPYMKLGTACALISSLGISGPSLIRNAAKRSYSALAALCVSAREIASLRLGASGR